MFEDMLDCLLCWPADSMGKCEKSPLTLLLLQFSVVVNHEDDATVCSRNGLLPELEATKQVDGRRDSGRWPCRCMLRA